MAAWGNCRLFAVQQATMHMLQHIARKPRYFASRRPSRCVHTVRVRAAPDQTKSGQALYSPSNAKDAVNTGLKVFNEEKNYQEAVRLFKMAMELKPSEEEASAAMFNLGCAYAKTKQWKEAADAITEAINKYNLRLAAALKDDDLTELRDRREWLDALANIKGGMTTEQRAELRSEAKAPFRFPRLVVFGALLAGAGLGLIIITTRLVSAIQGGEGAPDLQETAVNFGVNSAAVAVLLWVVRSDLQRREKDVMRTTREELLARLRVDLGKGRIIPLGKLRGEVRPVIIAGGRNFVDRAVRQAEQEYEKLRERGVALVPLILDGRVSAEEAEEKLRSLKAEFQRAESKAKGFGAEERSTPVDTPVDKLTVVSSLSKSDKRWLLTPFEAREWREWVEVQMKLAPAAGADEAQRECYLQVQLDGTVRTSGLGLPPWKKIVADLPELGSLRTTLTDGIGPSL